MCCSSRLPLYQFDCRHDALHVTTCCMGTSIMWNEAVQFARGAQVQLAARVSLPVADTETLRQSTPVRLMLRHQRPDACSHASTHNSRMHHRISGSETKPFACACSATITRCAWSRAVVTYVDTLSTILSVVALISAPASQQDLWCSAGHVTGAVHEQTNDAATTLQMAV